MIPFVGLAAFLILPAVAAGQTADVLREELAKCAAEEGELRRLVCYDALAESIGVDGPQPGPASGTSVGKWSIRDTVNPIDDSRTVVLTLLQNGEITLFSKRVGLFLRCRTGETAAYIAWSDYLGTEAEVTSRVGSLQAETRGWTVSTDGQATFFPGNDVDFINSLLGANVFVAQVTPYGASPVTAIFDTTGLSEALLPLRETCRW